MNVNDTIKHLQSLVAADPAVGELLMAQQSCFDAPYIFDSNSIAVCEMYTISSHTDGVLATFDSEEGCRERATEDELDQYNIVHNTVLVIGSF